MDIRDIRVEAPKLSGGHLEFIYQKGAEQLNNYRSVEELPLVPLDVNTRKSQVVLKDFIGRISEELFEGYESIILVLDNCNSKDGLFNTQYVSRKTYQDLLNNLQNANEEQADALGFYISLFLFCNILPEDIYRYGENIIGKPVTSLNELMSIGVSNLYRAGLMFDSPHNKWNLLSIPLLMEVFELDEDDASIRYKHISEYTPGFHNITSDEETTQSSHLWQIVYLLNVSRNLLKNRPWKQTEVMTKELEFQESIVKSFIYYLGYLACNGFNQDSLVTLFNRKQALNMWRIKTKY